jgi:hypothetical protein
MYKNEVDRALSRLSLGSGTPIHRLVESLAAARISVDQSMADVLSSEESSRRSGNARLNSIIRRLGDVISEVSLSSTAIQLHQLGEQYDSLLREHPELESLLRPGRQMLAALAGSFDVVLKEQRSLQSLVAMVGPGAQLATCFDHYEAVRRLLGAQIEQESDVESTVIEIVGAEDLGVFSETVSIIAMTGKVAAEIISTHLDPEVPPPHSLRIQSIESGSPIQIKLSADSRTLRMVLAMIRDAFIFPYRKLTRRGQLLDAMETLKIARDLGVDTPQIIEILERAVSKAAERYERSIAGQVAISVNGRRIEPTLQLELEDPDVESDPAFPPRLPGPKP